MTHPKHASSDHDILDVIRRRWSPRAFDAGRDVAPDDLRTMFEAARWAASSYNEQPWRFIVGDRQHSPQALAAILSTLDANNVGWAKHAPVLVVVAVNTVLSRTGGPNQAASYDAGQAVGFLALQATSLGISVRRLKVHRDAARGVRDPGRVRAHRDGGHRLQR
jgi:nitroreductase